MWPVVKTWAYFLHIKCGLVFLHVSIARKEILFGESTDQ